MQEGIKILGNILWGKSASRSMWTGSCVNKEFGFVNKGLVVKDYFDKRFDGSEVLDKRSKTTG